MKNSDQIARMQRLRWAYLPEGTFSYVAARMSKPAFHEKNVEAAEYIFSRWLLPGKISRNLTKQSELTSIYLTFNVFFGQRLPKLSSVNFVKK